MTQPVSSSLSDFELISNAPIPESIRKLKVIHCDICKTSGASYDVFVKGIEGVRFLRRYCGECLKKLI
jgi:hypothetical protein